MSYLKKLRATTDRKELAELLGYKPSMLTSIVYMTPLALKYTTFSIPKKSGGVRTIKAPNPKLKKLQKHLATVLYACLEEIEAEKEAKTVSFGFRKGGKITDNAKNHKRRRYVLNLDIEGFFPAFNFGRVRGFFLKDKNFLLPPEVATTIAQIACDGLALPQGSPCSPVISELLGQILDLRLLRLSKKHRVTYSRYADDISISTNNRQFPKELAFQEDGNPTNWVLGDELINKIQSTGFTINSSKTRMSCSGSRQMVTGLLVNNKVNIKSEYYRNARAMCDSLFQTGKYYTEILPSLKPAEKAKPKFITSLFPLEGILSHIYMVTQSEERRDQAEQRKSPRAIRELYRRFLFYKNCIALRMPLIITEGKTDPIYLREAIRYRTAFQPLLGLSNAEGFQFLLRFFNYGGQAHEIMDLGGGTGDLKSIILDYLRNIDSTKIERKPFKHKPMLFPVIMVVDNDDGLASIAGTIKSNLGIAIDTKSTALFYHLTNNLYLIKTPESGKESCIEDLFPKTLLDTKLKGKSFNPASKIDPSTQYSKEVFAKSVVKPNASSIDFSGFDPLLARICAAIEDYRSKI